MKRGGDWEKALHWYLEATQMNPRARDSLGKIATHYRLEGKHDLAYMFALQGSRIPIPEEQTLFSFVPHYHFANELSISAYYTPFKEEGLAFANEVVLGRDVPWYIKSRAYCNMVFYVHPLKNARYLPISIELPLISPGSADRYQPMNPAIQKTEKGYEVICRVVNHTQKFATDFKTIDPEGIFRSRNYLLHYDRDFKLLSQTEIVERLPRERLRDNYRASHVQGLEDCRTVTWKGKTWFTCSLRDTHPSGEPKVALCELGDTHPSGEPKVALCELGNSGDSIDVKSLTPLKGPEPMRCEKNWLPFVKDGSLYAIYSWDPFILYKPNPVTGEGETVLQYVSKDFDLSFFRGSAGPIPLDDGYLALVHEYAYDPSHGRIYFHRFVYLDQT